MEGLINRQYVGARYVPKIMGEWNKALRYEALSVVTYLGNSFTSKVPVPPSIDINNTDYWVNTANYNAQYDDFTNHVNTEILSMNSKLDEGLTKFNNIPNNYNGSTILCIGDSIGEAKPSYFEKSCEMLNATCINISKGGYGFSGLSDGMQYITIFNEWYNKNPNIINDINFIFITVSVNDADYIGDNGAKTYVEQRLNYTINSIKDKIPKAEIHLFFDGIPFSPFWRGHVASNIWTYNPYFAMSEVKYFLKSVFSRNFIVHDSIASFIGDIFYVADNIHPTSLGQEYYAGGLLASLNSNIINLNQTYTATFENVIDNSIHTKDNIYIKVLTTSSFKLHINVSVNTDGHGIISIIPYIDTPLTEDLTIRLCCTNFVNTLTLTNVSENKIHIAQYNSCICLTGVSYGTPLTILRNSIYDSNELSELPIYYDFTIRKIDVTDLDVKHFVFSF